MSRVTRLSILLGLGWMLAGWGVARAMPAASTLALTLTPALVDPGGTLTLELLARDRDGQTITLTLPDLPLASSSASCTRAGTTWTCAVTDVVQVWRWDLAVPATAAGQTFTATASDGTLTATATATVTGTPQPTATATATLPPPTLTPWIITATPDPAMATPTATPVQSADREEPNNTPAEATLLTLGQLDKRSLWPRGDVDYYRLVIKDTQRGLTLTVETLTTLDTQLQLLAEDGTLLAANDDISPIELRSKITWTTQPGTVLIRVSATTPAPELQVYSLVTTLQLAPVGPLPTPGPLDRPAWDGVAGNYSWDTAAPLPVGQPLDGLTFGCPNYAYLSATLQTCTVPDFFAVTVKGGGCYEATTTVAPGTDTNLIVYGPERDAAPPWAGNDDAAPDDLGSRARFCVHADAGVTTAYLLVGPVGPVIAPIADRTYSLAVTAWLPPTPTPTAIPAAAPLPPVGGAAGAGGIGPPADPGGMGGDPGGASVPPAAMQPPGADAARPGITVELLPPAVIPLPTAEPEIAVPLELVACYDRNQNQACDVDEGISGVTVFVATTSGTIVGQARTDSVGAARLTVRVPETALLVVSVPAFAATQQLAARSPRTQPVMIRQVAPLPALLP